MSAIQQALLMPSGATTDPFYSNVTLLLHMDGENGGTTFIDNSPSPKTAQVSVTTTSTAVVKYGSASALFNGTSTQIRYPVDSGFDFGSSNFTLECWIYPIAYSGNPSTMIARWGPNGNRAFIFYISGGFLGMGLNNFTAGPSGTTSVPLSTWSHVAAVRSGNTFNLFLNGILDGTTTAAITLQSGSEILSLGANNDIGGGTVTWRFNGYIDDLRITKGVARYTSNFTPPTAPYPNS